jgi:hypothetical protein
MARLGPLIRGYLDALKVVECVAFPLPPRTSITLTSSTDGLMEMFQKRQQPLLGDRLIDDQALEEERRRRRFRSRRGSPSCPALAPAAAIEIAESDMTVVI